MRLPIPPSRCWNVARGGRVRRRREVVTAAPFANGIGTGAQVAVWVGDQWVIAALARGLRQVT